MNSKNKKIVLIYGGPSSEHDVSVDSAKVIFQNLDKNKYLITQIFISKLGKWRILPSKRELEFPTALSYIKNKYDLAFLAMHGFFGEDGHIQSILDMIGLPYTGSSMHSSALAIDKAASNAIFITSGFNVPDFNLLNKSENIKIKLPFVVKPQAGGSSVGTTIVRNSAQVKSALKKGFNVGEKLIVQEYIKGREFTCGVLEKNGKPFSLIPTEIIPKSDFFDYKSKYKIGMSNEITPPNLPSHLIRQLQELALKAHKVLACRGMSRSDFILKGSKFYILETNTIPGMTATSLLPQGAKAAGISFSAMLDLIIQSSL